MSAHWSVAPATAAEHGVLVDLLTRQLAEHDLPADGARVERAVTGILEDQGRGFLLVARVESVAVGVAYVAHHWSLEHGGPSCWLEELYVLPQWRCRGIGSALVRTALERAHAQGCLVMDLEVTADHARAAQLYEREGFRFLRRDRWVRTL